ncbi:hypothetical protein BJV77DRAFT_963354 [Russula vinacea]|nr:hypothetical protein BJV77DRAFT_963354 [Russula vinacea]
MAFERFSNSTCSENTFLLFGYEFFYFNVPGGEGKGECEKIPHASGKPAARWLPSRTRDNGHGRFPDRWSISVPTKGRGPWGQLKTPPLVLGVETSVRAALAAAPRRGKRRGVVRVWYTKLDEEDWGLRVRHWDGGAPSWNDSDVEVWKVPVVYCTCEAPRRNVVPTQT